MRLLVGVVLALVGALWASASLASASAFDLRTQTDIRIWVGGIGDLAPAGDVNGDGHADFLIGARPDAYVVFGRAARGEPTIEQLVASGHAFGMHGSYADWAGASVAALGDVNGDGENDYAVGAPLADENGRENSGSVYIVFGQPGTPDINLADLLGDAQGIRLDGAAAKQLAGWSVAEAGDVNGDGLADVLVGAPGPIGSETRAYVIFGQAAAGSIDLGQVPGNGKGYTITATTPFGGNGTESFGSAVASARDVNADGIPDQIIGAPNSHVFAGGTFVAFGRDSAGTIDADHLSEDGHGYEIGGGSSYDVIGATVASAGDVNGDGRPDVLISGAYVVYSAATPTDIGLSEAGYSIHLDHFTLGAAAGDVSSDGVPDQVLEAPNTEYPGRLRTGALFTVFGRARTGSIDLKTIPGGQGYEVVGADYDNFFGGVVGAPGDVNGDGRGDLLGADRSSVFVVFSPRPVVGTSGSNDLVGRGGNNVIWGRSGSDRLRGGSYSHYNLLEGGRGADVLIGGSHADVLDGGPGRDRLYGGWGPDSLFGGTDADRIQGGRGADLIDGNPGDDVLIGGPGRDTVIGDGGDDWIDLRDGRGGDLALCGAGWDVVLLDKYDQRPKACEVRIHS